MAIGVGAGADGGVAGRGFGVGVVEVAIGEPGALVHEQAEAAALELGAIAIQVVAAELVDDYDHDQLGVANVGLGRRRHGHKDGQKDCNEGSKQGREKTRTRLHDWMINNQSLQFRLSGKIG